MTYANGYFVFYINYKLNTKTEILQHDGERQLNL